uniref:SbcD-like subunit of palindrome specific endonuclease n=1 Tax=Rhizobium phage IG49 TaxID=3129228 RepID=A0AAU8HYX9_9CAUD
MKAVVTGDWHLGKGAGKVDLGKDFIKAFDWMIKYMTENGIKNILHCGDLFDTKRYINFETTRLWKHVLGSLEKNHIRLFVAHGNHDVPSTKDMRLSLFDIADTSENVITFGDITEWQIDGEKVLFVPYGKEHDLEGEVEDVDVIICHSDDPPESHGAKVFSGHIHHRSDKFVGTLSQLDWGQVNDNTGFLLYDGGKTEFVNNPNQTFRRVELIEGKIEGLNPVKWVMNNKSKLAGANLEIKVDELTDKTLYQKLVAILETVGLNDLQLTEVIEFSQEPLKSSSHDVVTLICDELKRPGAKTVLEKIVGRIR